MKRYETAITIRFNALNDEHAIKIVDAIESMIDGDGEEAEEAAFKLLREFIRIRADGHSALVESGLPVYPDTRR